MKALLPWDEVEEVTFECEPGTLTDHKLKAIREVGVTRLSLGVENFSDHILEINGRAHSSKEIWRAYGYARDLGFPQINIDLIAGMVEETEENWRDCIRKTIELSPDSVTIYQMEIPYNTTIYKEMKAGGQARRAGRRLGAEARLGRRRFRRAGKSWLYGRQRLHRGEGQSENALCLSRQALGRRGSPRAWRGQLRPHRRNTLSKPPRLRTVRQCGERGPMPVYRALTPTEDERLIREFVLQLKLGRSHRIFREKIRRRSARAFCRAAPAHSRLGLR